MQMFPERDQAYSMMLGAGFAACTIAVGSLLAWGYTLLFAGGLATLVIGLARLQKPSDS